MPMSMKSRAGVRCFSNRPVEPAILSRYMPKNAAAPRATPQQWPEMSHQQHTRRPVNVVDDEPWWNRIARCCARPKSATTRAPPTVITMSYTTPVEEIARCTTILCATPNNNKQPQAVGISSAFLSEDRKPALSAPCRQRPPARR